MATVKPCLDCHRNTSNGSRCPACQKSMDSKMAASRERRRGTRTQRGYDNRWGKISKAARSAQPFCSRCGTTEDLTTHHVVPKAQGGTAEQGVAVLCRTCHAALHAGR